MRKILLSTTAAAAGMLIAASSHAAQITAGPSVQDITFTGNAAAGYVVTAPTLDLLAFDTTNSALGSAQITGLSFTTGPEASGLFTADANSATFSYTSPDGDSLTETIHITQIQDGTVQPKVYFVGDAPSAIVGDMTFVAAFSAPDTGDWIMNSIGVTLTNLVGSAAATISALEKVPASSVSEPSTLGLVGGAFLFIGWLNQRRIRDNAIG